MQAEKLLDDIVNFQINSFISLSNVVHIYQDSIEF